MYLSIKKKSKPLTELLQKNSFGWNSQAKTTSLTLKKAMTQAPRLALPDFSKSFILETDAYEIGVGVVLVQEGKPLAFLSQALSQNTWDYTSMTRSCYNIDDNGQLEI